MATADLTPTNPPTPTAHCLSVVIPAYNEQDGIQSIVERVLSIEPLLAQVGVGELELIVVDDGSRDSTAQVCSAVFEGHPGTRLISHTVNRGYGAALKTGFQAARGDLVGFLDADGTYPPEYFPQLCQAALQGAELVVGSRRSGASSEMPRMRRLGNLIWSTLVSLLSGQHVADPASGMRVFQAGVLEKLYPLPDGLNLTPVMSTRAVHEGVRLVEVPIPYTERLGRSKLNVVRDGMRFLQTILWTALNYNPVRILGGIGLAMLLVAGILAVIILGVRLAGVTTLGPLGVAASFTIVALTIAGVDLFALGIVFNYLVSLFHKRPVRQGLFGKPIFKRPLENNFGWLGLLSLLAGLTLGLISFILGSSGWTIERLWLYLLGGTMLILLGLQLLVFWVIVQVLSELSQREAQVQSDMEGR